MLMADDLYEQDVLCWSETQADLLRRLARGERVNDIDWAHVVEEIEDVGLSQLQAVQSHLRLLLVHLLKIHGWPAAAARHHWRGEASAFQQNAAQRFTPSMHQRIDINRLYIQALEQLDGEEYDERRSQPAPEMCPFTLDDLLNERRTVLERSLTDPMVEGSGPR